MKEIGNVNSNSYGRFSTLPIVLIPRTSLFLCAVKQSGPYGGADNSTYYCAYVQLSALPAIHQSFKVELDRYLYFEKRRIVEGKKKTPKRLRMEKQQEGGVTPDDARRARGGVWVLKTP